MLLGGEDLDAFVKVIREKAGIRDPENWQLWQDRRFLMQIRLNEEGVANVRVRVAAKSAKKRLRAQLLRIGSCWTGKECASKKGKQEMYSAPGHAGEGGDGYVAKSKRTSPWIEQR